MTTMEARIKAEARRLGFAEVAICEARPLSEAESRLRTWLERAYHGTMDWMARSAAQRIDPRAYFPDAASMVVVALNYYQENTPIERPAEEGNISIYARGRDYHKVIRKKLKALLRFVQEQQPGARGRVCVDSFPLMEKAFAVKSGIGWIGKHTNLIIKRRGSYYFLGELLLSLPLKADPPFTADHCGNCNRCQIACPTDALNEAYVLDARRCISYLTIEHDGPIDAGLSEQMENWVFGCDICQAVCPWNRFSTASGEADFESRIPDDMFRLEKLQTLTEDSFDTLFAGTPVRRSGYRNFMRNVHIAAQNRGATLRNKKDD